MARVLVVDDDPEVRRALVAVLRRGGYEVVAASDGREGIDALSDFAADLVITDINMPEMDGIEVILGLREIRPDVPVVAISGGGLMAKESLLGDAESLGAVSTLEKPFEALELLEAVDTALRSRSG